MRVAFPFGPAQAMLDIGPGFGFVERTEMVGGGHPLAQLLEPRAAEDRAELRLPEQKALQRHCLVDDDVGQHAQFFERFERQVLRLVDDQQRALAGAMLGERQSR